MLSCTGPLPLPGGRSVLKAHHSYQRSGLSRVARASRKQSQGQSRDVGTDLASDGLPADLDKLSKLAKAELQHQLEVRGLDKDGNKEELASRLLDNLIAQESVLSTNPPDRVKLQQQLEQASTAGRRGRRISRKATASADPQPESSSVASGSPQAADSVIAAAMTAEPAVEAPAAAAAAAAGSRRGRKTSRKATSSIDPLPSAAEIAAGAAADLPAARRGRKTSRKATTSTDPLPAAAPADIPAAAAAGEEASADAKPARRGRKTSRKATTSADPLETPAPQDPVAAAAEAATAAAADSATESLTSRQRGRRSKTTAVDPSPAAEEAAPAKAGHARRASRKSSVLEPESTGAAPTAAASAEAPARQRGRRTSSAKTATADAAAPAPSTPADAPVSRAKLLAQQLAKKEIATHGQGAAAAGTAAAASSAAAAAAPGSAWVGADELLYAGSQAQSDCLLMGGDNSMQAVGAESSFTVDNGSVDEVFAQISAERAAGLANEPTLRPEATLSSSSSSSFDGVMNPPSAGAADAAASWGAPAAAAADAADGQHPSLTDCVAAVEEPLVTAAEAVEVDEAPDAAMAAFDHMYVHIASPGTAEADLQHPNLSDCVAAVEEPLLAPADPAPLVVVDEAPDAAMAAFDHTSLDSPAAAAVAGGNQAPNLQDIALAVESSPLPPSLDESLGEDEEPDAALAAFDHIDVPAPAAAAATAAAADDGAAAAAYDQAYLDPMQPSATVGSGSVDLADAEVVVTAAAAAAPAAPAAAVPAKQQPAQQQQLQQKAAAGGAQGAPDLSVMVQRWWASVVAMFEDWQKNLSGPK